MPNSKLYSNTPLDQNSNINDNFKKELLRQSKNIENQEICSWQSNKFQDEQDIDEYFSRQNEIVEAKI